MRKNILVGPEFFWLFLVAGSALIAKANIPVSQGIESFIEDLAFWIVIPVILTFGLWLVPKVEKRWLLVRVWFACIIGGHFVLTTALDAHSQQGPGIGTAYIVGMIVVIIFLIVGTAAVVMIPLLHKLFRKDPHHGRPEM